MYISRMQLLGHVIFFSLKEHYFLSPVIPENDPFCLIVRDCELGTLDVEGIGVDMKEVQCIILCRMD